MNKKIELFEKYFVIIGGILGIISFIWQAFDVVQNRRDIITSELSCNIYNDPDIQLSLKMINLGQRPVYIQNAYIEVRSPKLTSKLIVVSFVNDKKQKGGLTYVLSICPNCGRNLTKILSAKRGANDR